MRRRLLITAAVLLLVVALTGCAGRISLSGQEGVTPSVSTAPSETGTPDAAVPSPSQTPADEPSPSEEAPPAGMPGMVSLSVNTFEYTTKYIETYVSLPTITGPDSAASEKINAVFEELMASAKASNAVSEEESKQMEEDGYPSPSPYIIGIEYSVPYNKNDILCVVVTDYRYLGGAHGGAAMIPYIFDLKTGDKITLNDLMLDDSGYREFISKEIRNEIDKRTQAGEVYEIEPFMDIGDAPWFYLTGQGLVFFFQQYEYFPYANGIQEFDIPYGDLSKMLKEEYARLEITPVSLEPGQNSMPAGDIGRVAISGSGTAGYSWKYEVEDGSILEFADSDYQIDANGEGDYIWDFRALKPGTTSVIFTFSKDWESGESAQPETVQVTVTVK